MEGEDLASGAGEQSVVSQLIGVFCFVSALHVGIPAASVLLPGMVNCDRHINEIKKNGVLMVEESSECSCTPQLHLLLLHAFLQSSLGGQKAFIGFISGTQTKPTIRRIEC